MKVMQGFLWKVNNLETQNEIARGSGEGEKKKGEQWGAERGGGEGRLGEWEIYSQELNFQVTKLDWPEEFRFILLPSVGPRVSE